MQINRLSPTHATEYRAFMLQAYASEPEAFTATVSEREALPLEWWPSRISGEPDSDALVFGAFVDTQLAGVTGLRFESRPRTRHKARLFGMSVQPQFRGQGIARVLVEVVLDQARSAPFTQVVQLTVVESNTSAIRLYESCGFVAFGTEPLANKVGKQFFSVVHMWRKVCPDAT